MRIRPDVTWNDWLASHAGRKFLREPGCPDFPAAGGILAGAVGVQSLESKVHAQRSIVRSPRSAGRERSRRQSTRLSYPRQRACSVGIASAGSTSSEHVHDAQPGGAPRVGTTRAPGSLRIGQGRLQPAQILQIIVVDDAFSQVLHRLWIPPFPVFTMAVGERQIQPAAVPV